MHYSNTPSTSTSNHSRAYQTQNIDNWDDRPDGPRQTTSRAGRLNSYQPPSRAGGTRSHHPSHGQHIPGPPGPGPGTKHDRSTTASISGPTDVFRNTLALPGAHGKAPNRPHIDMGLPITCEPTLDNIIATSDDAAAFFQSMGHMLAGAAGQAGDMLSPNARPPPAGMRGALSWGVGPNAYENDGRPGTRSGGTAFDLEGRPLTRNSMRPASRMQQLGPGRPGTGLTTQPSGTLRSGSYAAAAAGGGNSGNLSMHQSMDLTGAHPMRGGGTAAASQLTAGLSGSMNRRPQTQHTQTTDMWPAEPSTSAAPPSRGGRSTILQPLNVRPTPAAASQARQPGAQRPVLGPTAQQPPARTHAPNIFKVEEEGDVDAFLAALSDEEGDTTNMDDLRSYLKTLDQDKGPEAAQSSSKALQGTRAAKAKVREQSAQAQADTEAQTQAAAEERQRQAKRQRATKQVTRLLETLIEQAVKTSEVNAIIAAAEAKALAEEAELKVVLEEHGWDRQVREVLGSAPTGQEDFSNLMSSITATGSKPPSGQLPVQRHEDPAALRALDPEDDFKHLSMASSKATDRARHAGQQLAPINGGRQPIAGVAGGMARYHNL